MKPTIILLLCIISILCILVGCREKPLFKQVITIDGFADTIRINEHGQVDITNHWRDPAVTILADTAFNEKFYPDISGYHFPSMYERMQDMEAKTRVYKENGYTVTETIYEPKKDTICF